MKNTEDRGSYMKHYPQGNKKCSRDEVKNAILMNYGVLNRAKDTLGIGVTTLYKYIEEYELEEFRDKCRDNIEDLALQSVIDGLDDPKIALGMLSHLRQSKQASDRFKINVDKEGGVQIVVNSKDEADDINKFLKDE